MHPQSMCITNMIQARIQIGSFIIPIICGLVKGCLAPIWKTLWAVTVKDNADPGYGLANAQTDNARSTWNSIPILSLTPTGLSTTTTCQYMSVTISAHAMRHVQTE